ncbi:hypothetical protein TNCV_4471851 [Trichonephila clavipes]|uniref:Uncharacterized protein n=1 Tax=Trichonephila clavipes TaxID=2585209 RepID=A0A8X6VKZ2_TRICX|nr:hypothetical protein TNCV_4471851 [Trichonephila clavipes]
MCKGCGGDFDKALTNVQLNVLRSEQNSGINALRAAEIILKNTINAFGIVQSLASVSMAAGYAGVHITDSAFGGNCVCFDPDHCDI